MSLKEIGEKSQEIAQRFSDQEPPPHEERIRRAFFAVSGREPTAEEIQKQIASSDLLQKMASS